LALLSYGLWAQDPTQPAGAPQQGAVTRAPEPGQTSKITLETSETLFSVLTALNSCGYDQDLASSDPLRVRIRQEVQQAVARRGGPAQAAREQLCRFYRDHQQPDPSRQLAQYVSLALYLSDPPKFAPTIKESDLPPDAAYVLGFVPLLQRFYETAGLHAIWQKHQPAYEALVEQFHKPVADTILRTDLYLKLPLSGYLGRRFVVFLEPMGAPGQVNARNFGPDYFVVVSSAQGDLKLDAIRHTYLHYVLDPLSMKRASTFRRLEPLTEAVATAPIDESYKRDISLLVTESLIRAVEARMLNTNTRAPRDQKAREALEAQRRKKSEEAVTEGFVLTRYFYDALLQFEQDPVGLKDIYGDWLYQMDVAKEKKRAAEVTFSSSSAPDPLNASKRKQPQLVDLAEQRMAARDFAGAQQIARQALESNQDPARALFVLARAASQVGDMKGARVYFERTLAVAREPRILAWSHIYLGRMFDLQEEREAAVAQYRAALAAGDVAPETRTAAERGLRQPYELPPQARGESQQPPEQRPQ
jgi:tetratricopeptide (TPR) repeat protein